MFSISIFNDSTDVMWTQFNNQQQQQQQQPPQHQSQYRALSDQKIQWCPATNYNHHHHHHFQSNIALEPWLRYSKPEKSMALSRKKSSTDILASKNQLDFCGNNNLGCCTTTTSTNPPTTPSTTQLQQQQQQFLQKNRNQYYHQQHQQQHHNQQQQQRHSNQFNFLDDWSSGITATIDAGTSQYNNSFDSASLLSFHGNGVNDINMGYYPDPWSTKSPLNIRSNTAPLTRSASSATSTISSLLLASTSSSSLAATTTSSPTGTEY